MFAAIVQIAVRVAPVAVRIATHPKTIQVVTTTAIVSGTNIAMRTAKLHGQDLVGQRQAEAIASDRDPVHFADDPRRIAGIKPRLVRNVSLFGQAVATEGRIFRLLVKPVVHLTAWLQAGATARRYMRLTEALDATVKTEESITNPSAESVALAAKTEKVGNKVLKRTNRLDRVRLWKQVDRVTKGEQYLAAEIGALKLDAVANEVRIDTVENVLLRALEESIDASSIDYSNPREAGMATFVAVSNSFKGEEIGIIRSRVLKGWIFRHQPQLTKNQWQQFTQGWAEASRVAQTV